MFEFISTSDWHLEGLDTHFPQDGVERQMEVIDRIYQYAVENGIKYVIVPGDITDKHKMRDTTKRLLIQHFVKYDEVIQTIYIGGNHDWADQSETSMDLIKQFCDWTFLKNLKVILRPEQVEIEGVIVNFLPFPTPKVMKHKKACLNFCHVETAGALGDTGRPLKTDKTIGCPERDFTISGHIHLYQYLERQRFLYNGDPYQKTFAEGLPKGFCHVRAQYKKKELVVKHKFIDSKPGFKLETLHIADQKQWSELQVNPAIRYRVIVTDGITVPTDIRTRVPNIAQLHTGRSAVDMSTLETIDVSELELVEVNPVDGLKSFLKASGLKKSVRAKALAEMSDILSAISS